MLGRQGAHAFACASALSRGPDRLSRRALPERAGGLTCSITGAHPTRALSFLDSANEGHRIRTVSHFRRVYSGENDELLQEDDGCDDWGYDLSVAWGDANEEEDDDEADDDQEDEDELEKDPKVNSDDPALSLDQLEERYNPDGDGEHPVHTRARCCEAVQQDLTSVGYWQWVFYQLRPTTT